MLAEYNQIKLALALMAFVVKKRRKADLTITYGIQ